MSSFYNEYKKDVYSQNGEDGILEEIFNRLNITTGYACEFGAWDGKHLSNTFNLVQKGWNAVYIESDSEKYIELLDTCREYPSITPIKASVDHNNSSLSLDNILKSTNIPKDFDLLSIDIDSYDYQVWKSLSSYNPKVVVIEINSGVNPEDMNHIHTPDKYQGTAFMPMYGLGQDKGYTFIVHTGNMIFVRDDIFPRLNIPTPKPLDIFIRKWLEWNS